MKLANYVKASPGFRQSVNVKYDLHDKDKVDHYIPVGDSIEFLSQILDSGKAQGASRSILLQGSYGTGKSHLCTVVMAILSKAFPAEKYNNLLAKLENINPTVSTKVREEINNPKYLPVIVSGGDKEIDTLLLSGLKESLKTYSLDHIMPSTLFSAAFSQIDDWKSKFPRAYSRLESLLKSNASSVKNLKEGLQQENPEAALKFSQIYEEITFGAKFEPFNNESVESIYLAVSRVLPAPYKGIVVLFDEFGAYIESRIRQSSMLSLNKLQEFAEVCNTSGDSPIQLILITHQPLSQYAVNFGQDVVNTWKKIEGRFRVLRIANRNSQAYELIANVLIKDKKWFKDLPGRYKTCLKLLQDEISKTRLFADLDKFSFQEKVLYGCFPLHPITTYVLPLFSEMVAQNERTIFTFLSSNDYFSLGQFLKSTESDSGEMLTIDYLYDYFSQQMQSQTPESRVYDLWIKAERALARLTADDIFEAAILKGLCIISAINRPTILPPNENSLRLSFLASSLSEIDFARGLKGLISKRLIFEGISSGNYEIIEPGELDIEKEKKVTLAKRRNTFLLEEHLNSMFLFRPVIAKRYNDDYYMTRFFSYEYISSQDVCTGATISKMEEELHVDGKIFLVLCRTQDDHQKCVDYLDALGSNTWAERRSMFVVSDILVNRFDKLERLAREHDSLIALLNEYDNKEYSSDRFEILLAVGEIEQEINKTLGELYSFKNATFFHTGSSTKLVDKSKLTQLVSEICLALFSKTPKFNNELINKHILSRPIYLARKKVVDGLLKPFIEPRLGISGTGPAVAIYRSLLIGKNLLILDKDGKHMRIADFSKYDTDEGLKDCLQDLYEVICRASRGVSFEELLKLVMSPPYGLREGVVPIVFALLFHAIRLEISVVDDSGTEMPLTSESIDQGLKSPAHVFIFQQNWSEQKAQFCKQISALWSDHSLKKATMSGPVKEAADSMKKWFMELPRFTRDSSMVSFEAQKIRSVLRQVKIPSSRLLFEELPRIYGFKNFPDKSVEVMIKGLKKVKTELDNHLVRSLYNLDKELSVVVPNNNDLSFMAAIRNWVGKLDLKKHQHRHTDDAELLLNFVDSYEGESEISFLSQLCTLLIDLRPEDFSDVTLRSIPGILSEIIQEILLYEQRTYNNDNADEIVFLFKDQNGQEVRRTFYRDDVSGTGILLQNVLSSYLEEYGQAITNNEKRQILINLIEAITK